MPCRLVAAFGFEAPHFSGPPGEVAVSPLKFLIEFRSLHNLTANWGYEKGGARSLADHNAWIGKGLAFFFGGIKKREIYPEIYPQKRRDKGRSESAGSLIQVDSSLAGGGAWAIIMGSNLWLAPSVCGQFLRLGGWQGVFA